MYDVYVHTSPSGKRYVGYSVDGIAARWSDHVSAAKHGGQLLFHRAIRKYGADAFRSEVLAQVASEAEAKAVEIECIAAAGSLAPGGYNLTEGGEGMRPSEPTREKMRAWQRGRELSAEHRANVSRGLTGKTLPTHVREKIGKALIGRPGAHTGKNHTPEHCAKISASLRGNQRSLGYRHTEEARARISASLRGNKRAARKPTDEAGTITLGSTRIKAGL